MIEYTRCNLLEADVEALINTINIEQAMYEKLLMGGVMLKHIHDL